MKGDGFEFSESLGIKPSCSDTNVEEGNVIVERSSEKKEEKAREKEFTDRPKHPSSAYIRFSTDNMSKVKTEYP